MEQGLKRGGQGGAWHRGAGPIHLGTSPGEREREKTSRTMVKESENSGEVKIERAEVRRGEAGREKGGGSEMKLYECMSTADSSSCSFSCWEYSWFRGKPVIYWTNKRRRASTQARFIFTARETPQKARV